MQQVGDQIPPLPRHFRGTVDCLFEVVISVIRAQYILRVKWNIHCAVLTVRSHFVLGIASSYWKGGGEEYASRRMPLRSFSEISDVQPRALMRHKKPPSEAAFKTKAVNFSNWLFLQTGSDLYFSKMALRCFTQLFPVSLLDLHSPILLTSVSSQLTAGIDSQIFVPFKVLSPGWSIIRICNLFIRSGFTEKSLLLYTGVMTQAAFAIISPKLPKSKALLFIFLTRAALVLCNKGCQDMGPLKRMTDAVCCDKLFVY